MRGGSVNWRCCWFLLSDFIRCQKRRVASSVVITWASRRLNCYRCLFIRVLPCALIRRLQFNLTKSKKARDNPGSAGLVLTALDGRVLTVPFQLDVLQDNKYHFFTLDPLPYHLARIVSTGGAGVSTWEAHHADGRVTTCIVYEFANGTKRYTPGCARF